MNPHLQNKCLPASLLILVSTVFSTLSHAAFINVPAEYKAIQPAVNSAKPGDTVLVGPGKYKGNIKLKEAIILQGAGADSTVIEGDGNSSVIEGAKGAVVEGFTITGSGKKGTIGVTMDAGIICNNAPMTIANNRITGNNSGLNLYYSPSNVINNEISGSAVYGIYLAYSDSLVSNNVITGSKSHGIYNSYSNPEIINNTIASNFTGIFSEVSRVVVKNNVITNNTDAGIRWAEFIGSQYRAEPLLSYNLAWGNGEDFINVKPGTGDIVKDPLFAGAGKKDFRLKAGSPAMKAGEGGADMGAFGGAYAQKHLPASPKEKSYASLKHRGGTIKEPDYMSQTDWRSDAVKYGKGDFEGHCVPCHGAKGQGDGLLADTLDVRPRDLSDKSIMSARTDEMLFKVIKEGGSAVGFSPNMMPFNIQFSDEEIRNIISFIRAEICKCRYEGGN